MAGTSKRPTSRQRNVSGTGKPATAKKSAATSMPRQSSSAVSKQTLPKAKKPAGVGAQARMGAQNTRHGASWEKIARNNSMKRVARGASSTAKTARNDARNEWTKKAISKESKRRGAIRTGAEVGGARTAYRAEKESIGAVKKFAENKAGRMTGAALSQYYKKK